MENIANSKTRYGDADLEEFKQVIIQKMNSAREELADLSAALQSTNPNGPMIPGVPTPHLKMARPPWTRNLFTS